MGDYIRMEGHRVIFTYRCQWWKVLEVDEFQIIIMNEVQTTRVFTKDTLGYYKVMLHPYSRKWNR